MTKPSRKTQGVKQYLGIRKVGKTVKNSWSVDKLMEALHVLDSTSDVSIRGVAKQYNWGEAKVKFRRKKIQAVEPELKKAGMKCAFDVETEKHLAKCIAILCSYVFSLSMAEI